MIDAFSTDTSNDFVNAVPVYKAGVDKDKQIRLQQEVWTAGIAKKDSDWRQQFMCNAKYDDYQPRFVEMMSKYALL